MTVDDFLTDGFHRLHAARAARLEEIDCDVREGTLRDAILYSCSANDAHGWRRTNDDKRRSVLRLLNDPEWKQWSDGEIASRCLVSQQFVSKIRPRPVTHNDGELEPCTYVTKHGTVATMDVRNIGASKPEPESPPLIPDDAPVRNARIVAVHRETNLSNSIWEIMERWQT